MVALTSDELLAWHARHSTNWRALLARQPQALDLPCDVREGKTVRDLIQHIVAVELRYAERLAGRPETAYDAVGTESAEALYDTHDRAMTLVRELLAEDRPDWEETMEFVTRSAGTLRATRRIILVHLLTHSIRHYAQLATLLRQHGVTPGWGMDYLFMAAT